MAQINDVKGFIIDMDGVLWHGNHPIVGLGAFFFTSERNRFTFCFGDQQCQPDATAVY